MLDRASHPMGEQFPFKLYALLELADQPGAGCSGAAGWLPHGRAFRIHDERVFMEAAVPMFFRQTKFRSFCRQLNLWGYRRVLCGVDAGAWYHACFLRGRPDEMRKMVRVKIKGTKRGIERGDPNFYRMPPLPLPGAEPDEGSGGADGRGLQRRVTLESAEPPDAFRFYDQDLSAERNAAASDRGRDLHPRPQGSPRSIVPPTPRRVGPFERRMRGVHRAMGNMLPSRSYPLARRSKSAASLPTDEEMARIKQRLAAGSTALPFRAPAPPTAPASPPPLPSWDPSEDLDQAKMALTVGLEPLPFTYDLFSDDFANHINNVIHMV